MLAHGKLNCPKKIKWKSDFPEIPGYPQLLLQPPLHYNEQQKI